MSEGGHHLRLTLEEAKSVYEAAEKVGVRVEIGHYRRLQTALDEVGSVSRERDEALAEIANVTSALDSMQQNRDTVQRHFNECTIRAEASEAAHAAARQNFHTMQGAANELRTRAERLASALKDVRLAIILDPTHDTLWATDIETAVDRIDAALQLDQKK